RAENAFEPGNGFTLRATGLRRRRFAARTENRIGQGKRVAVQDQVDSTLAASIDGLEKLSELRGPPEVLGRVPLPRRVASDPHVEIADDDNRSRAGLRGLRVQSGLQPKVVRPGGAE